MDIVYADCAGLDVHKKTVVACVMHSTSAGPAQSTTRSFGTMPPELMELRERDQIAPHRAAVKRLAALGFDSPSHTTSARCVTPTEPRFRRSEAKDLAASP